MVIVMKWARLDNDRVIEITDVDPAGRFHPSLIWESVPLDVTPNSTRDGDRWNVLNWDVDDQARAQTLQTNIEGLQNDASAADRIADYERELIEVQARIEQAAQETQAAALAALEAATLEGGEGADTLESAQNEA
jgi:hypothetical protein